MCFPPPHEAELRNIALLFFADQLLKGLDEAANALRETAEGLGRSLAASGHRFDLTVDTDMVDCTYMVPVFTVAEVARLLEGVDGREALTPRAIRYYARSGMVAPSGRLKGRRGSRLYTVADIALLRLAWLLRHKFGLTERGVWAVLVLEGDAIREQLLTGQGAVVFDDPAPLRSRGAEDQRADRPARVSLPIRIPLTLVWPPSLSRHAQALRKTAPKIWTGAAWMPAAEAVQQVSA